MKKLNDSMNSEILKTNSVASPSTRPHFLARRNPRRRQCRMGRTIRRSKRARLHGNFLQSNYSLLWPCLRHGQLGLGLVDAGGFNHFTVTSIRKRHNWQRADGVARVVGLPVSNSANWRK